jgi:hypothetical protein
MQKQAESFLWNAQNEVHNYFKEHAASVYEKLQTISRLSASTLSEDAALLLTEVRRILKAVADHVQPAVSGKMKCSDGLERELGDAQYMNRLQEFIGTKMRQSTAKEVALAEVTFLRRLNDMASKGVHDEVVTSEARQALVGMYMFLFNLCQHLTSRSTEQTTAP